MHHRALRYVDEVVKSGSIRRAAARLNVSPTAINRQILLLEQNFGAQLFERLPRTMRLTSAGELVVEHVRRTLSDFRRLEKRIDDMKGLHGGEARIATMNGLDSGVVAGVVAQFCAKHPRVKINVKSMFIREILKAVTEGEADIAIGYNLPRHRALTVLGEFPAELRAIVAPSHPLARRRNPRLADVAQYPLVLADPALLMHQTVIEAFEEALLPIEPALLSNSADFMKKIVSRGDYVSFLSRFDLTEEEANDKLRHIDLSNAKLTSNRLIVACRQSGRSNPAANLIASDFMEYVR